MFLHMMHCWSGLYCDIQWFLFFCCLNVNTANVFFFFLFYLRVQCSSAHMLCQQITIHCVLTSFMQADYMLMDVQFLCHRLLKVGSSIHTKNVASNSLRTISPSFIYDFSHATSLTPLCTFLFSFFVFIILPPLFFFLSLSHQQTAFECLLFSYLSIFNMHLAIPDPRSTHICFSTPPRLPLFTCCQLSSALQLHHYIIIIIIMYKQCSTLLDSRA